MTTRIVSNQKTTAPGTGWRSPGRMTSACCGAILVTCGAAVLIGWFLAAPRMSGTGPSPSKSGYLAWYLQNGLWKSDAHTVVAAFSYFVEPEPIPSTNLPAPSLPTVAGTNLSAAVTT